MLKIKYLVMMQVTPHDDDLERAITTHPVICNYRKKAAWQNCRFLTKPYLEKIVVETDKTFDTKELAEAHKKEVIKRMRKEMDA